MAWRIVIRCPETGETVPTGVVVPDTRSFDALLLPRRHLTCPSCGRQHAWTKDSAWVEPD